MIMPPRIRKMALTLHVASSVGWVGAAGAYLALAIAALGSEREQLVRAAYLAMEPIGWFALVPLSAATLLTGLVSSLGTHWGLFRHYWVIFKLLLSVIATAVLLGNMKAVVMLAAMAAGDAAPPLMGLRGQILHASGGIIVLLIATVLAVFKPRGLTRYGWRTQQV